ncbi:hypothetical protein [Echinimonas agarilytica]|uniref:Uncharacterized protein n=1 Tax=Echinimonas agarilytica TaxID=1215918 RepID=A0AA42B6D1_9GAMM|nr:hypothetical protein [Echinimonas agarilytica]MCM2678655.1 hypothetical protein [Echinimonas agarilytica]
MSVLKRYIAAVQQHLPTALKADVADELTSILEDKFEAEQERLGRDLNAQEVHDWLATLPAPIEMAAGYQEHQSFIGQALLPYYRHVLKVSILATLGVWAVFLALGIFTRNHVIGAVFDALPGLFSSVCITFTAVTIVFVALEHGTLKHNWFGRWSPCALPPLKSRFSWIHVSRSDAIASIIAYTVVVMLLNGWTGGSEALMIAGGTIGFSTELSGYVTGLSWVIVGYIAVQSVILALPFWTRTKLALLAAVQSAELLLWWQVMNVSPWIEVNGNVGEKWQTFVDYLNGQTNWFALIAMAIVAVSFVISLYRMYRLRTDDVSE